MNRYVQQLHNKVLTTMGHASLNREMAHNYFLLLTSVSGRDHPLCNSLKSPPVLALRSTGVPVLVSVVNAPIS